MGSTITFEGETGVSLILGDEEEKQKTFIIIKVLIHQYTNIIGKRLLESITYNYLTFAESTKSNRMSFTP